MRSLETAESLNVVPDIHPDDYIFKFQEMLAGNEGNAIDRYYRVGRYSANLVAGEMLKEMSRVRNRLEPDGATDPTARNWQPNRILDFASAPSRARREPS